MNTYVTMEIGAPAYNEIAKKLKDADYGHCLTEGKDGQLITLEGVALQKRPKPSILTGQPADHERAKEILSAYYAKRFGKVAQIEGNYRARQEIELIRWLMARIRDGSIQAGEIQA